MCCCASREPRLPERLGGPLSLTRLAVFLSPVSLFLTAPMEAHQKKQPASVSASYKTTDACCAEGYGAAHTRGSCILPNCEWVRSKTRIYVSKGQSICFGFRLHTAEQGMERVSSTCKISSFLYIPFPWIWSGRLPSLLLSSSLLGGA